VTIACVGGDARAEGPVNQVFGRYPACFNDCGHGIPISASMGVNDTDSIRRMTQA
jgi:hypothetical protein